MTRTYFYTHAEQLSASGQCLCRCHFGALPCVCGFKKSVKPRKVNLESRVKPFTKYRFGKRGGTIGPISVTSRHNFHAPRYTGK